MNLEARPRRSALYMPASNPRAVDKARTLACDVVILDLEDAVLPDAKDQARQAAVAAVATGGFGAREVVVRVNALGTPDISSPTSNPSVMCSSAITSRNEVSDTFTARVAPILRASSSR